MNKEKILFDLKCLRDNITDNNFKDILNNAIDCIEEKDKVIDEANKILSEILVVKQGNIYRPVKNTSSQDVYKTICMLNEVLKTPYRVNYEILERCKNVNSK